MDIDVGGALKSARLVGTEKLGPPCRAQPSEEGRRFRSQTAHADWNSCGLRLLGTGCHKDAESATVIVVIVVIVVDSS